MYILNEKEYIREILASGNKPDNISNGYLITLIAKYYFDRGKDPNILIDTVKAKMLEFNIEGYQEYRYANKIKKTCIDLYDSESKNLFRELEYVPIYEKELKVVESLPNDRQKKFMFTLFAIARYMNSEGWINKKDSKGLSEVFKLANVTLSSDKKNELLHELYSNGYIHFGKKVNNLKEYINRVWRENRFLLKPMLVMFLIYLVGALALILAGVHFADDIARTNYGYAGWNGFSRYLSTVLAYGVQMDGYLFNIAPLPQILAIFIFIEKLFFQSELH